MNILVLYTRYSKIDRQTFTDSLRSFERYAPEHHFVYLNVETGKEIKHGMQYVPYDAIIMHYTFLAKRQNRPPWPDFYAEVLPRIQNLQGIKVLIPQDEYYFTQSLRDMIRDFDVDLVFTNSDGHNRDILYPREEVGDKVQFERIFTGYIDEKTLFRINKLQKKISERYIGLGYRGMKLPYYFGSHGQLKHEVALRFDEKTKKLPHIHADLGMTGVRDNTVLYGDDWLKFLLYSRCTLACLGGSSLLILDDSQLNIFDYCTKHPNATFLETAEAVFPGEDGHINMQLLSPKMFEAAMTKSCLVMVEGDYYGVFEPNIHYIEVKRDFSNIDDVIEKIQNHSFCQKIAQQCYDDIVAPKNPSNPYTYRAYANTVLSKISAIKTNLPATPVNPNKSNVKSLKWFYFVRFNFSFFLKRTTNSISSSIEHTITAIRNKAITILKLTFLWPLWHNFIVPVFHQMWALLVHKFFLPVLQKGSLFVTHRVFLPLARAVWGFFRYQMVYLFKLALNLPYVFLDTHPRFRDFLKKILMVDKRCKHSAEELEQDNSLLLNLKEEGESSKSNRTDA